MSKRKSKYVIKGDLLPPHFIILGLIFIVFGLLSYPEEGLGAFIFLLIGGLFTLTRFGVVVDKKKKTIRKYTSIFLIRIGRLKKYELLTCFWLTSRRMKDVWQSRGGVSSSTSAYSAIHVYLITSDADQFYLFTERSKQGVYNRLGPYMQAFGISCLDRNSA